MQRGVFNNPLEQQHVLCRPLAEPTRSSLAEEGTVPLSPCHRWYEVTGTAALQQQLHRAISSVLLLWYEFGSDLL